jgi:hypothetical protein
MGIHGKPSRFTSEIVAEMHIEYSNGKSLKEIGAAFAASHERVRQLFIKYGYWVREHGKTLKNKSLAHLPIDTIQKRYEAGERLRDLASEYDCSEASIYNFLNARGVRFRKSRRQSKAINHDAH